MDTGDGVRIYTGTWINWSHGPILGATLTLPQKHSGLLAVFLAIYVPFSGRMFWKFLCFIMHQANATRPGGARDGLHHQVQVILRNNGGAGSALWEFTTLPFYWRGRTGKPLRFRAVFPRNLFLGCFVRGARDKSFARSNRTSAFRKLRLACHRKLFI